MWSDIDYMNAYRDFTYDETELRYKGLPEFVKELNTKGMHYIPILDAGISLRPGQNYDAYDKGKEEDLFIKIRDEDLIV